jgi:hypothetical protein
VDDLVISSTPRTADDIDRLCAEAPVSAVLSLQDGDD